MVLKLKHNFCLVFQREAGNNVMCHPVYICLRTFQNGGLCHFEVQFSYAHCTLVSHFGMPFQACSQSWYFPTFRRKSLAHASNISQNVTSVPWMMSCHSTETTSSFHERLIYIEATVPLETVLGNSCVIPSRLSIVCLVAQKWANIQVDHLECSLGLVDIKRLCFSICSL